IPVWLRAASAGQKGLPLLTPVMPLAQFAKSTACIPSTLINKTGLMCPWWLALFWAPAVLAQQTTARESNANVFFIKTSRRKYYEMPRGRMLQRVELLVKITAGMWKRSDLI